MDIRGLFGGKSSTAAGGKKKTAGDDAVYYYGRQLSGVDHIVYSQLVLGLKKMEPKIGLYGGDFDSVSRISQLVLADHPEIFWFAGAGQVTQKGSQLFFSPFYTMSEGVKNSRQKQLEQAAKSFKRSVRGRKTSYDRLEAAFTWLVKNTTYVDGAPDNQNICSVFLNHKSVCAGYAKSLQYLLQSVGIECLYVWGDVIGKGRHGWNIVNLDGAYYQTDVTLGDRSFSDGTSVGNGLPAELEAEYGYMCMTDEEARRDRIENVTELGVTLPACISTAMNYYRRNNLFFAGGAQGAWINMEQRLSKGQTSWCYQFASEYEYDMFLQDIDGGRFTDLALRHLKKNRVSTCTSSIPSLYVVIGWVR